MLDKHANIFNLEFEKRETRALSQEIEDMKQDKFSNDAAMEYEEEILSMEDEEGENDIILIEEEYKSVLDENLNNSETISRQDFKFIKLIGSGAHAKVYLARKNDNEQLFAIKVLNKKELNKKKQAKGTKTERKILVSLPHSLDFVNK